MISNKQKLHQIFFALLIIFLPSQLGLHFWPNFATVFGIRVDYLAPAIYLTDLLVGAVLVSWWWERRPQFQISTPRRGFARRPFKFPILLLFIALFIYLFFTSLLVAQNHGAAFYKLVKIIEFFLLGFYVYKNGKLIISNWKFPAALSAAVAYSSLIAWGQFLIQNSLGGPFWWLGERTFNADTPGIALFSLGGQDYLRPYTTFPHPNALAGFLLVGVILLGWEIKKKPERRSVFTKFAVFLGISAIFLSFSQSAWLAGITALLLVVIPRAKTFLTHMGWMVVILILASLILPQIPQNLPVPQPVSQRLELARAAWQMILDYPLTGVGLNNLIVRLPEYSTQPQISWWLQPVHNIFLLVFAETGIIGFGLFLWLLFVIVKKLSISNPPDGRAGYQLVIALLVILLTGAVDHYWLTLQQTQLLLTIVLALSFSKS